MTEILILHGWGSSGKNWNQVKNLLENQGYRVFVPDLPGFGENSPPPKAWSVDDYVNWLSGYCEKQNLSQFFLLGHSFGGRIAIKFAGKYPQMLSSLILCAAAGITPRPQIKIIIFSFLSRVGNVVFSLPLLKIFRGLAQKIVYLFVHVRDYQFIQAPIMKETFKKIIEEDLTYSLSHIKTRTLIIWGDKDLMTPVSDGYKMKEEILDSTLKIIPGGKHGLNLQFPEKLTELILDYLKN